MLAAGRWGGRVETDADAEAFKKYIYCTQEAKIEYLSSGYAGYNRQINGGTIQIKHLFLDAITE